MGFKKEASLPEGRHLHFYDDLDEKGVDKRMPQSLIKEFEYDPDLVSERLVKFQQFLHNHHQTVENCMNRAIDGLFFAERRAVQTFRWLEHDAPALILPTLQVSAAAYATWLAHRGVPPLARLGPASLVGLMAGFLTFPSWRQGTANVVRRTLIDPLPMAQRTVSGAHSAYQRGVYSIVAGWTAYDRLCARLADYYQGRRQRVLSFLKPPPRRPS